MSPSPVQSCSSAANLQAALTLLVALQRCGLKRLVLCPGSRSAPLAVAAGLLERTGLTLLTGVDERSAAFLALGLGRADGVPAAVVTTSGSAVANLLPAVVEADHGRAPLLLLSADRPARLKGCGANQTVNQEQFLAPCCRRFLSADPAGLAAMAPAAIEALAVGAWQAALQPPAGPVHLNLPLEEPLHGSAAEIAALEVAASGLPRPVAAPPLAAAAPAELPLDAALLELLDPDQPGAVVVGPWRAPARELEPFAAALIQWQRRSGWPVLADGCSGLRGWPGLELIHSYDLLLAPEHQLPAVPQLLRIGPMPSSRRLQQWITACEGTQLLLGQGDPRNLDATGSASQRWGGSLQQWLAAHTAAQIGRAHV